MSLTDKFDRFVGKQVTMPEQPGRAVRMPAKDDETIAGIKKEAQDSRLPLRFKLPGLPLPNGGQRDRITCHFEPVGGDIFRVSHFTQG